MLWRGKEVRAQDRPCPGPRPPGHVPRACPRLSWEAGRLSCWHVVWSGHLGRAVWCPFGGAALPRPPRPCSAASSRSALGHRQVSGRPFARRLSSLCPRSQNQRGFPSTTPWPGKRPAARRPLSPRPPAQRCCRAPRVSLHYGFRFWQDLGFAPVNSQCFPLQNKKIIIVF